MRKIIEAAKKLMLLIKLIVCQKLYDDEKFKIFSHIGEICCREIEGFFVIDINTANNIGD